MQKVTIVLLFLFITSLCAIAVSAEGEHETEPAMQGHDHNAMIAESTGGHAHTGMDNNFQLNPMTFIFAVILIVGFIFFFRSLRGKDLMEYNMFKKIMKSKWYPKILQIPTLIFFGFIVYFFFFGPLSYAKNPGNILAWTLWWPLVPLTFILFGRLWCAICPLPIIGDFIQKFVHPTRKPGQFLIKYGIWITDGIFILITLFDRLYGMVDTPLLSGIVFLFILFGVIIFSIRYERRTFCKHICFLGGVSGNYSMLSGLSIESKDKAVCASCRVKGCYFGSGTTAGCPFFTTIPAKDSMRNCTLCANCIKNCPNDNIAVRLRGIAS
ncbi:MAG: 4Fe-4S binding protein, partial [Nanoarchaeota archaeon]